MRNCPFIICISTHIAGHYVPATGQVIVESNSVYAKNLKGIAIGNGWVDPYLQYAAYGKVHVCKYIGTCVVIRCISL